MDQFLLVFLIVIAYILLLLTVKKFKIGKIKSCDSCSNCCPDCNGVLNRIRRTQSDQVLHHFTFRMFDARRYFCNECGCEGLRWENQFRPGRD